MTSSLSTAAGGGPLRVQRDDRGVVTLTLDDAPPLLAAVKVAVPALTAVILFLSALTTASLSELQITFVFFASEVSTEAFTESPICISSQKNWLKSR